MSVLCLHHRRSGHRDQNCIYHHQYLPFWSFILSNIIVRYTSTARNGHTKTQRSCVRRNLTLKSKRILREGTESKRGVPEVRSTRQTQTGYGLVHVPFDRICNTLFTREKLQDPAEKYRKTAKFMS